MRLSLWTALLIFGALAQAQVAPPTIECTLQSNGEAPFVVDSNSTGGMDARVSAWIETNATTGQSLLTVRLLESTDHQDKIDLAGLYRGQQNFHGASTQTAIYCVFK